MINFKIKQIHVSSNEIDRTYTYIDRLNEGCRYTFSIPIGSNYNYNQITALNSVSVSPIPENSGYHNFIAMTRKVNILLLYFLQSIILSQNLVPNGSFEEFNGCPNFYTKAHENIPSVNSWFKYGQPTPDYFNRCNKGIVGVPENFAGIQDAQNGNAYLGLIVYKNRYRKYREIAGCELKKKLKRNELYYIQYYISLADKYYVGTNHIHVYFNDSKNELRKINNITDSVIIKDTSSWILLKSFFFSKGNEEFLYIGNKERRKTILFYGNYNRKLKYSYYYVDNVYLVEINKKKLNNILKGDSIKIFNYKVPFDFDTLNVTIKYDSILPFNNNLRIIAELLNENPFLEIIVKSNINSNNYDDFKSIFFQNFKNISFERIKLINDLNEETSNYINFTFKNNLDKELLLNSIKKEKYN